MSSFGVRFGQLVKRKRGIEGLKQDALAIKAFGKASQKTRISELENGKIAGPHQATVDALVVALEISEEELRSCREGDTPDLPNNLLENLAQRFGVENPDAPPAELEAFLKEKAKDFAEMSARLAAMGEAEGRIKNVMAAANAALAEGDFDAADARLADAEEMQQTEHTLVQVRKQSEMRVERGQARLLDGDAAGAAVHFEKAAGYFAPFDQDSQASLSRELGLRLQKHGVRYGGEGLPASEKIYHDILEIWTRETNPQNWAMVQNDLAVALRNQGTRLDGAAGAAKLGEAVVAYRAALEVRTREAEPVDWAMTQNNLAIALWEQGKRHDGAGGAAKLGEAVVAYRAALEVFAREAHPVTWAVTQNNLGAALFEQGRRLDGPAGEAKLGEAVVAYRAALEIRTREAEPVRWAMTQNNLGNALQVQGERLDGAVGAAKLGEAVEAYRAALEVYTREAFSVDWATTQNNLGVALFEQGRRLDGPAGEARLRAAVEAYRAALEVRTREAHPVDWAGTQENMAFTFEVMASKEPEAAEGHLRAALEAVEGALEVYDPVHMGFRHANASRTRDWILAALEAAG